ncbi:TIGR04282 family arsenosugar biosynthesis glycosyltransferase [Salegentibacter sp. JZCK2]|uniref:TIGR04282 family arsenosugar biosynthesis glycosyltransferase n=1 Tax=Salegentibacter tibetensis TaxID=2873600 RepID=UPI001CCB4E4D|nr:TIGR04282 family arsenosugar biosynthesis glycosyltransferase [Salegentibacter tibetensis]MBZ9731506.1 TIGR04282 family arsenosugar biosynthesis glycosyltransferase [Salegentibacter tibetensis]
MISKTTDALLMIFTKNPELGKVKTRLANSVGDKVALNIYKFLLSHTVSVTKNLEIDKRVYYSEEIPENDLWPSASFSKKLQRGGNLGEKMENAFQEAFNSNYKRVIIIGSDLLNLAQQDLENAFLELGKNDVVIGPAKDGGYYLLGMKSLNSDVFKNKAWSTSSVLSDTLKDFEGKKIKILETRNDIDEIQDIEEDSILKKFIESRIFRQSQKE